MSVKLKEYEYKKIIYDWNKTEHDYPKDKTIHALFEAQVAKTPEAIALVYEDKSLTYQALNQKANQLARYIRTIKSDLKPDTLIAICVERSIDMIIGILGILKAGAAYVPIDPHYPEERIQYMLDDTQATLVLSQRHLIKENSDWIALDEAPYADQSNENLTNINTSKDLAYVIYTSGTSGRPKGVMISANSLINLAYYSKKSYHLSSSDRLAQYCSFSFDVFCSDWTNALLTGASLYILPEAERKDLNLLTSYIQKYNITYIDLPTSIFQLLNDEQINSINNQLRILRVGSEKLEHLPSVNWTFTLINAYGPTETTIECLTAVIKFQQKKIPIGKPLANVKAYILDTHLMPLPIGITGELYIGGACLARGYLNQPNLTAERFILNPFATEKDKKQGYIHLYKTGDLVRWLADGNIEYIGRNDFQVKLNGYRIELGEIENALVSFPGITQGVVLLKEKPGAMKYLVGYYVAKKIFNQRELIHFLRKYLPEYMIPNNYVHLEKLPLTIHGKIDRQALPEPILVAQANFVPPRNEIEDKTCIIWEDILRAERVGITDDFFQLNGNSILAIRIANRMSQLLKQQISVASIFKHKTIKNLMDILTFQDNEILIKRQPSLQAPLSFAQERLWFIDKYEEGTNAYNIPFALYLNTTVNIEHFKQSLQSIVARHEVLRSLIHQDDQGIPYQVVMDSPLSIIEKTVAEESLLNIWQDNINYFFNLKTEYPFKVWLYDTGMKHIALIVVHHIAFDAWSSDIFLQELTAYYHHFNNKAELELPKLAIQYKDFSAWQRNYLSGTRLEKQLTYWQKQLLAYEPLTWITDNPRPSRFNYAGDDVLFELDPSLTKQLRMLAKSKDVTLYNVLLSAFYLLVNQYTAQNDLIIGTLAANRHCLQVEPLIGFFVNTLALRIQLNPKQTIDSLITQIQEMLINAQIHQEFPFEKLVEHMQIERDLSRHPLFQIMFDVQHLPEKSGLFNTILLNDSCKIAKFDLTVIIYEKTDTLVVDVNYATSLYKKTTIENLISLYTYLLKQIIVNSQCLLKDIQLLSEIEKKKILGFGMGSKTPLSNKTLTQLFEEQVTKHPNVVAAYYHQEKITYLELNARANQLAQYLQKKYLTLYGKEIKNNTVIALISERSINALIAIIAILKTGAAYLPLDHQQPSSYLSMITDDAKPKLSIINHTSVLVENLLFNKQLTINLNDENTLQELSCYSTENLAHPGRGHDLMYIIYTSGSTGMPKGVMVEHHSVERLVLNDPDLTIAPGDIFCHTVNLAFDVSVYEIWLTLLNTGSLLIIDYHTLLDTQAFALLLQQYDKIKLLCLVTELFHVFSTQQPNLFHRVKFLMIAGDSLNPKQVNQVLNACYKNTPIIFNGYGPTESAILATRYAITNKISSINTPIGKPANQTMVYLLNQYLHLAPIGMVGELYIGGPAVSRGYLNRPELNKEKFIQSPISNNPNDRLYKTGDLARWMPDGNLEFLGRIDNQVKYQGYRIELDSIVHTLCLYNPVTQAKVIVDSNKHLVAYFIASISNLNIEDIKIFLHQRLPFYMLPQYYIQLEKFPLTPNGKIDIKKLPLPIITETYSLPSDELEKKLFALWKMVLKTNQFDRNKNFFDCGGNSFKIIELQMMIMKHLYLDISAIDLFQYTTIADQAHYLRTKLS